MNRGVSDQDRPRVSSNAGEGAPAEQPKDSPSSERQQQMRQDQQQRRKSQPFSSEAEQQQQRARRQSAREAALAHQASQTERDQPDSLGGRPAEGAADAAEPQSSSGRPRKHLLQRSRATIDSPPASEGVSRAEELNKQDSAKEDQQQRQESPSIQSQSEQVSAPRRKSNSNLDSASQTGSEQSNSSNVATQTNEEGEGEAESGSFQARRESRRRRSSRKSSQRRQSVELAEQKAAAAAADAADPEAEEVNAVRRRASKSQPPAGRRKQMVKSSSKSTLIGRSDLDELEQRNLILNNQDLKRSVSVSPSLNNNTNINIRHILENVAQLEGPFQEPHLAFKVAFNALESSCWSTKVEGILALIRLVSHHEQLVSSHLHELLLRLSLETKNLRSTVARSAIFALGDFCLKLKRLVEPDLDIIVQALLNKSIENNGFIRDDIKKALTTMLDSITHWRLALSLLNLGANHKNQLCRRLTSQFVARLVDKMGPAKCLVGAREISAHLIPAAAKFAQDNSPQTRYFGRLILLKLMQHGAFDRLMRKNLTPNLYKSTIGILESIKRRGAGEPPLES